MMPPMSELNKRYLFAILAVCLVSATHHGYHSAVLNIPHLQVKEWMTQLKNITPKETCTAWTVTIAVYPFGCFFGTIFTNIKFGFLKVLFYVSFITIGGQAMMNMSKETGSIVMFHVGRFILAATGGFCNVIAPKFLWDISCDSWERTSVIIYYWFIMFSVVFSQTVGLIFIRNDIPWILIIMVGTIPTALGMFALKFCPESPKYKLLSRQNEYSTIVSLVWFRNTPNVGRYLDAIKREQNFIKLSPEITIRNVWCRELLICFVVIVSQPLCGASLLIYSSTEFFEDFLHPYAHYVTIGTGIAVLVGCTIALCTIQLLKSKGLLLISLAFLGFSTSALMAVQIIDYPMPDLSTTLMKFIVIGCLIVFGIGYGLGVGPIHALIVMEYFHYSSRTFVSGLLGPSKYLLNTITVVTFYSLDNNSRLYLFMLFAIGDFACFIFVLFFMSSKDRVGGINDEDFALR